MGPPDVSPIMNTGVKMAKRYRNVHEWPPLQQGEAKGYVTKALWRYIAQHKRWMGRQCPTTDNYLALHRADAARAELNRRTGSSRWRL